MTKSKPIVFLDRDGVINAFPGKGQYVTRQENFQFLPRALEAVRLLTEADCEIYVISNQGCVSRGLITEKALGEMTERMLEEIRAHGGNIQKVYYCFHQKLDNCECKKPKIKLFLEVLGNRKPDMKQVFFVGDSEEDLGAAKNLGCQGILVLSGKTTAEDLSNFPLTPDVVRNDLYEAAQWIIQKKF